MKIDDSLIMSEVNAITQQGGGGSQFKIECSVLAGDEWVSATRIEEYTLTRDYLNNFGDKHTISIMLGMGDYTSKIFPHRDKLKVVVRFIPVYDSNDQTRRNERIKSVTFIGILLNQENPVMTGSAPDVSDIETLNRMGPLTVTFQLFDEAVHQIRMASVGNAYTNMSPTEVLKHMLTQTTSLVSTTNQKMVFGVSVVPGYNETIRRQVLIPHGTRLVDAPFYLQEKEGGIYATGLGCYLQEGYWYVFSPFNTQLFATTTKTLTILMVPPARYQGEVTYRESGDGITVIASGDRSLDDTPFMDNYNVGNGFRFADASKLLSSASVVDGNTVSMNRQKNLYEFRSGSLNGDVSNVQWGETRASSNPYPAYSSLAAQAGRIMSVEWSYADPTRIYPGMPVKIYNAQGGNVTVFQGTVVSLHAKHFCRTPGTNQPKFATSVTLGLFIQRARNGE